MDSHKVAPRPAPHPNAIGEVCKTIYPSQRRLLPVQVFNEILAGLVSIFQMPIIGDRRFGPVHEEIAMHIENTIFIQAPPTLVWAATEDLENWPVWTPTMLRVDKSTAGVIRVGSLFRVKQPGLPESTWTITSLTNGEHLSWETRRVGLRMAATHDVCGDGHGTRSTLGLKIFGPFGRMLWPLIRARAQRFLEQENQGLKQFCESRSCAHQAKRQ